MVAENNKITTGKIIFTLIYILMFPALLLFLSGDWFWVEGWIFGIDEILGMLTLIVNDIIKLIKPLEFS